MTETRLVGHSLYPSPEKAFGHRVTPGREVRKLITPIGTRGLLNLARVPGTVVVGVKENRPAFQPPLVGVGRAVAIEVMPYHAADLAGRCRSGLIGADVHAGALGTGGAGDVGGGSAVGGAGIQARAGCLQREAVVRREEQVVGSVNVIRGQE